MAKVKKTDSCWLWEGGSINSSGYGYVSVNGKRVGVHRAIYEFYRRQIPDGIQVCHTCDVRLCVNPDHLFEGTRSENALDAVAKGRYTNCAKCAPEKLPRGEANGSSKLTKRDVLTIKRTYRPGVSQRSLAERFGVTQAVISRILSGIAWSHV